MRPPPVQQPRPPVWVAGMWPNRRPFERAAQWDGVVPLSAVPDGDGVPLLRPAQVRDVIDEVARHRLSNAPFDVVVSGHWEESPAAYADAGVTWLIESRNAFPGWVDELRASVERGPAVV